VTFSRNGELADYNDNGLPEVVDAWGRPILYNRPAFGSTHLLKDCDFSQPAANSRNPWHNRDSYDLYSVGADGQTGDTTLDEVGKDTLAAFCLNAMNDINDGTQDDDIRNWK
jgi:hypothetical protein